MMRIRRICAVSVVATCALAMGVWARAQGNAAVVREQRANSLNGTVVDKVGMPVGAVAIAECSEGFRDCVDVAKSDGDGRFKIASAQRGKVHYLRFLSPGMNEEREIVTLS